MTLDDFLALTAKRLPTAAEIVSVCDELKIGFAQAEDGTPRIRFGGDLREEALALAALLRREPWRSQVMAAKGFKGPEPEKPCKEFLWRDGHLCRQQPEGEGAPPAGAWWWRWAGEAAWQVVPGREEYAAGHNPPEVTNG